MTIRDIIFGGEQDAETQAQLLEEREAEIVGDLQRLLANVVEVLRNRHSGVYKPGRPPEHRYIYDADKIDDLLRRIENP